MKETDRFIYNSIKEAENKFNEITNQYVDLTTHLLELNTETDEVKSQLDINGEIGKYYVQLIKDLKSLLSEDYESIEKEMEEVEPETYTITQEPPVGYFDTGGHYHSF